MSYRLMDVQGSGKVFLVEAVVLDAKLTLVHAAYLDQELSPGVLAVAGEKGVIQIKERQSH